MTTAGDLLRTQLDASLPEGAEWDEREQALLNLASCQADDIAALEKLLVEQGATVRGSTGQSRLNPVFAELRQQRLALARILAEVKLPDEGMDTPTKNPVKQRAANSRWAREATRRAG